MQSLLYVPSSNQAANASLMTVQTLRSPGATTAIVNTVANVPTKFYGTMGAPHTFTDPVTGETITIISEATAVDAAFSVSGSNIIIDAIAPGYVDTRGSLVGDIIVIKPVTEWANNLYNVLAQAHNADGTIKNAAITYNPNIVNYVASGAIIAGLGYGSTLTASLSAGVCWINGIQQTIAAVATRTYTASKDTYVDALYSSTGTATIVYTEVANNAASPALAANSIRLGIVVTGAANIAAATSISQGGFANIVPVISSQILKGNDTLGNVIYPKGAASAGLTTNPYKFGMYRNGALALTSGTPTQMAFDTLEFDSNNNTTLGASAKFTAPIAGYYQLNASVGVSAATPTRMFISIYKNGSELKRGNDTGTTVQSVTVSALVQLAAGDTVDVRYFSATAGGSANGQGITYFNGYLVSAS